MLIGITPTVPSQKRRGWKLVKFWDGNGLQKTFKTHEKGLGEEGFWIVITKKIKQVLLLENVFDIKNQFDKKISKNKQNNYALLWKPFHFKGRKMFFHWKFVEIVSKFGSEFM